MGGFLLNGVGIGTKNASGPLCVCRSQEDVAAKFHPGDVLVVPYTTNDLLSYIRQAAAVISEESGGNSHAATVGLTLDKAVIVGATGATSGCGTAPWSPWTASVAWCRPCPSKYFMFTPASRAAFFRSGPVFLFVGLSEYLLAQFCPLSENSAFLQKFSAYFSILPHCKTVCHTVYCDFIGQVDTTA